MLSTLKVGSFYLPLKRSVELFYSQAGTFPLEGLKPVYSVYRASIQVFSVEYRCGNVKNAYMIAKTPSSISAACLSFESKA